MNDVSGHLEVYQCKIVMDVKMIGASEMMVCSKEAFKWTPEIMVRVCMCGGYLILNRNQSKDIGEGGGGGGGGWKAVSYLNRNQSRDIGKTKFHFWASEGVKIAIGMTRYSYRVMSKNIYCTNVFSECKHLQ